MSPPSNVAAPTAAEQYVTLTVDLAKDAVESCEAVLYEHETLGLEIRDGEIPPLPGIRQPGPGEAILVATFGSPEAAEAARTDVLDAFPEARTDIASVEQKDWSVAWREQIRASTVGRLWVGPPWEVEKAPPGLARIVIEPKMAFGTGDHGTTQLCLKAIDAFMSAHPGASVMDVGTGTGVLALAAKKLGAGRVVAFDNDPVSVELARECAAENGVHDMELSGRTLDDYPETFDLVVANILANTLIEMAPKLAARTKRRLLLAGVLVHQAADVEAAFLKAGMRAAGTETQGEWIRLDFEPAA